MYQFKNEQGWRRFDLSSPSRKEANLEMCQKVEEVLVKKGFHVNPKFYLHKDLSKEEKEQAKALAKQRKATIVETEEDATHILHPSTDPDSEMFCKGVFKRGAFCLVHFYRMPESHDNWGQVRKLVKYSHNENLIFICRCICIFTIIFFLSYTFILIMEGGESILIIILLDLCS